MTVIAQDILKMGGSDLHLQPRGKIWTPCQSVRAVPSEAQANIDGHHFLRAHISQAQRAKHLTRFTLFPLALTRVL